MKAPNRATRFPLFSPPNLAWIALLAAVPQAHGQRASIAPVVVPGASRIAVSALNQAGSVAGVAYDDNFGQRAFLWKNGVGTDLGALGGAVSAANALNGSDRVVGYAATGMEAEFHAFMSADGTLNDLGSLGGLNSSATAVNDSGQVAGYSFLADGVATHAFLHSGGFMRDLGTLGGSSSSATALNGVGQVVGESSIAGDAQTHAFLYSAGVMRDLGTLGGTFSFAVAINGGGLMTGGATTTGDAEMHAFLHNGLAMRDLGTLGGTYSSGTAINESGQVIGDSTLAGDTAAHGFLYSDGVLHDLGTLGGNSSTPWALNNLGQVVGASSDAAGVERAFLWENGVMTDLNALLPDGSGWELTAAYFVNDAGQVVGTGTHQGDAAWFLMTMRPASAGQAPMANAGPDQTIECGGDSTSVTLNGTASSDPDGSTLTFEWFAGGELLGRSAMLMVALRHTSQTFTLRVTDSGGATAEDDVTVNVQDTTPPQLPCPTSRRAEANKRGVAEVPNLLAGLVVSDLCAPGEVIVTQSPTNGTFVRCGVHVVTVAAIDAAGNRSTCTTTFTVVDVTPPVVSGPREVTRHVRTNCQATLPDLTSRVTARDNGTPVGQLIKTQSPAPGIALAVGRHEVQILVSDAAGNTTRWVVLLAVVDVKPPRIKSLEATPDALPDGSRELVLVTLSVIAVDNCDPAPDCRIVSVTSSDPVTGAGDVTTPDWMVTGDLTVLLRAERATPNRLRTYTIKVACIDASGNRSTRCVQVPVRPAPRVRVR